MTRCEINPSAIRKPKSRHVFSEILEKSQRPSMRKNSFLVFAISSNCARFTLPTLFVFGVPLPLLMPAAFFNRIEAGVVLLTKVKRFAELSGVKKISLYANKSVEEFEKFHKG